MRELQVTTGCEVCGGRELHPVLDLGKQPLCDDLVPVGSTRICDSYPIEILFCPVCATAHQKYQVPKAALFPRTYHYRSRFTADVLTGMAELVDSVEKQLGSLTGLTAVDIGCNDGSLLDCFAAKGARTVGVEPTGAYEDALGRGHQIINDFFSESSAQEVRKLFPSIDVITFTNVFAHIEDLPGLLRALSVLAGSNTRLVIENHYLGSILEKNQFDTFYHEHPRTYSLTSFLHIARSLGKAVTAVEFPSRYGGNIRVILGPPGEAAAEGAVVERILEKERGFLDDFRRMREFVSEWKGRRREEILGVVETEGRLLAKAFPGRAAVLLALLGLAEGEIECVFEKPGSLKIGSYVPGTRIPIHSDDELFPRLDKLSVILNLAWHIPGEIEAYLRRNGFKGRLVHII